MHKAADSSVRHVWFSPSHNLLKWAVSRAVPGTKNPQSADNKERSTSVNHMASVVSGARLFPSQENKGARLAVCERPCLHHKRSTSCLCSFSMPAGAASSAAIALCRQLRDCKG